MQNSSSTEMHSKPITVSCECNMLFCSVSSLNAIVLMSEHRLDSKTFQNKMFPLQHMENALHLNPA